jgi:positive regulator of sigma E activity
MHVDLRTDEKNILLSSYLPYFLYLITLIHAIWDQLSVLSTLSEVLYNAKHSSKLINANK